MSFEDFVQARSGSLLRTALLLTGQNRAEAEDLLRLALERAYRHWGRVHATTEPERYVRRILANASTDRWRRLARRPEQPLPADDAVPFTPDLSVAVAERDYLLRALAQLPPRQRAVLVLRYFDDLPEEQPPRDLTARVIRRYRRHTAVLASLSAATSAAVAIAVLPAVLGGALTSPRHGPVGRPQARLRGAAMPPGSDVRLLVDGTRLTWYYTATRRIVQITGLPESAGGYSLGRAQGGYVGTPNSRQGKLPVYYVADGATVARRIGSASAFELSSSGDSVWLTSYPNRTSPGRAQLTSLRGQRIGNPVTLPAHDYLITSIGTYLLLAAQGVGMPAQLWDPISRRVLRTFGRLDAFGRDQVAWGRPPQVLNLRTGGITAFAFSRESRVVASGAFSSDETLLTIALGTSIDRHGVARAERLGVIDIATGRLITVPGVDLSTNAAAGLRFGWQPGTHRLLVLLLGAGKTLQVGYWQPGAARLRMTTAPMPPGAIGPSSNVLLP